jgi:hypothetical protein
MDGMKNFHPNVEWKKKMKTLDENFTSKLWMTIFHLDEN